MTHFCHRCGQPEDGPHLCITYNGKPGVPSEPRERRPHTKRDRVRRLRNRVAAINDGTIRSAMAGILDLLEDEL